MKPLFRITYGPVGRYGTSLLKKSIRLLRRNYPEADICICHNNVHESQIASLKMDVEKINQANLTHTLPYYPRLESWKLCPPRLRPDSHEIVMDNDVLLFRRVQEIDEFLRSNRSLLLEGRHRVYGKYEDRVPHPFAINSGIYGLPPRYDFESEIREFCRRDKEKCWDNWCDEQGVIAGLLIGQRPIFIKMESVMNYLPEFSFQPRSCWNGIHLIGSNRSVANMCIVKQILSCEI